MGCYCQANTSVFKLWALIPHHFEDIAPNDKWNYCLVFWALQITKELVFFFISTSAVFINEMVADFFQYLGQYQKKHTKIEEQETCFR